MACILATSAGAETPTQAEFDACLAQLEDEASGAACVVPIRAVCIATVRRDEVAAELACLNDALSSLTAWTDGLIAATEESAALTSQVGEFRDELTGVCSDRMTGDRLEDRRDFSMCQLAGESALYRNLQRKETIE